jgi:hypothetical protein
MTQRAILVGVQDYAFKPLTAPAKDARDMRDALVAAGIFTREETRLFVDDGTAVDVDGVADRKTILDALEPFYNGEECSRLFFYFSGHGASWRVSSGASVLKAVILCHGVNEFARHGGEMINVEELLERFKMRGPDEQVWVIDACRNIPESEGRPVVPTTTWADLPEIVVRRRSLVYAVAPLAQATAIQGVNSVFTREYLDGLQGKGRAAVYDAAADSWIVTQRSICDYARARLAPGLADWQRDFLLPRIEFESDPPPSALRTLPPESAPKPRPVLLKIDPDAATQLVSARLKREGATPAAWPPHQASPALPPAVYRFEAQLAVDPAYESLSPAVALIDTREADRIEVKVTARSRPVARRRRMGINARHRAEMDFSAEFNERDETEIGIGGKAQLIEVGRVKAPPETSRVEIETADRTVRFSATSYGTGASPVEIAPNYDWSGIWRVRHDLPAGLWQIAGRLGDERLGCIDVDLSNGTSVILRLVAAMPEAFADATWKPGVEVSPSQEAPSLQVSEQMGPIQSAVLPSILPLLALKAFDPHALGKLVAPWLSSLPIAEGKDPVSVALALDGDWGSLQVPDIGSATLEIGRAAEARRFSDGGRLAVLAVPGGLAKPELDGDLPPRMNLATLRVPGWGRLEFALPRVPGRIACAGAAIRAGGRFELSIASLAIGADDDPRHPRSESARAIAVGARLLGTGVKDEEAVNDAAEGKWIDPVLGALAWYAIEEQGQNANLRDLTTIARNMFAAFPSLADSMLLLHWLTRHPQGVPYLVRELRSFEGTITHELLSPSGDPSYFDYEAFSLFMNVQDKLPVQVQQLARDKWRPTRMATVLADQPVLAASVDRLADLAESYGRGDHWSVRRRALIDPGTVWNAVYSPDTEGAKHG